MASHLPAETEARPQTRHRYPVRRSILPLLLLSGLSQTRTVSHPAPKATGPLLWPASSLGPAPTQQLQLRTTVTTTRLYYVLRLCTMGTLNWACFHHVRIHADTCLYFTFYELCYICVPTVVLVGSEEQICYQSTNVAYATNIRELFLRNRKLGLQNI